MAEDHDQNSGEKPKDSPPAEPAKVPLDAMRQTVDEERKSLEELGAKIQEAKEHEKQLRKD